MHRLYPALYTGCKDFASIEEAWAWMESKVDNNCITNRRAVRIGSRSVAEYKRKSSYACGFYETRVLIRGVPHLISCNYD